MKNLKLKMMAKWANRVAEMRELLKTNTVTEVANHYCCTTDDVYGAMSRYRIRVKVGRFINDKVCVCGESFKPDKPTSTYCSRSCAQKNRVYTKYVSPYAEQCTGAV